MQVSLLDEEGRERFVVVPEGPNQEGWRHLRLGILELNGLDARKETKGDLLQVIPNQENETEVISLGKAQKQIKQGLGIWSTFGPRIAGEIVADDRHLGIKAVYGPQSSFGFWDMAVVCTKKGGVMN